MFFVVCQVKNAAANGPGDETKKPTAKKGAGKGRRGKGKGNGDVQQEQKEKTESKQVAEQTEEKNENKRRGGNNTEEGNRSKKHRASEEKTETPKGGSDVATPAEPAAPKRKVLPTEQDVAENWKVQDFTQLLFLTCNLCFCFVCVYQKINDQTQL